jgi:hypothetical protein
MILLRGVAWLIYYHSKHQAMYHLLAITLVYAMPK